MIYLTKEQILLIHDFVIQETGGSHGVRDNGVLHGLESAPVQAVFGKELYTDIFSKAAVYIRNIVFFHPFVDGNKRTAMTACGVFMERNGYKIVVKKGEIEKFVLRVIEEKLEIAQIADWLKKNSKKIKK